MVEESSDIMLGVDFVGVVFSRIKCFIFIFIKVKSFNTSSDLSKFLQKWVNALKVVRLGA